MGTAVQVQAGQHEDPVTFDDIEQAVRKAAQYGTSNTILELLILRRIVAQEAFDPSDLVDEASAKPGALLFEILGDVADFGSCGPLEQDR